MSGINTGILQNAYPLSSDAIKELERRVLENGTAYAYLDQNSELCFAMSHGIEGIKQLAWNHAYELLKENDLFTKKVYKKTGLMTYALKDTLQKQNMDDAWPGESINSRLTLNAYGFYFEAPYISTINNVTTTTMWYPDGSAYIRKETGNTVTSEHITEPGTYLYEVNKITSNNDVYTFADQGKVMIASTGDAILVESTRNKEPIVEFNTLEVVNNPLVTLWEESNGIKNSLVKVSDKTPTVLDMTGSYITIGEQVLSVARPILVGDSGHGAIYFEHDNFVTINLIIVINSPNTVFNSKTVPNYPFEHEVVFAEPGIYFPYYGEEADLNVRIAWQPAHGTVFDDTYPITWNTVTAVTNTSAYTPGQRIRFVKISNLQPSAEELNTINLTTDADNPAIPFYAQVMDIDDNAKLLGFDMDGSNFDRSVICVVVIHATMVSGIYFPEPGIYVNDLCFEGSMNTNCHLNIARA